MTERQNEAIKQRLNTVLKAYMMGFAQSEAGHIEEIDPFVSKVIYIHDDKPFNREIRVKVGYTASTKTTYRKEMFHGEQFTPETEEVHDYAYFHVKYHPAIQVIVKDFYRVLSESIAPLLMDVQIEEV